ncbi:protein-disulfide reductase DsbD family protein [Desulfohalovibrio reitneri]|uniref:protein-disulfide reductase DsbD family protein n=1 Tax=Desulfohalovibrio reitneri TaxID=1307759 RepID=UPI000A4427CB|nr:cytochrome c biogenesis protein CcdA [Desulfohalovibrio reitneri]
MEISFTALDEKLAERLDAPAAMVVLLTPDQGWYIYANDPGEMGQPTVLSLSGPDGQSPALYPPGEAKDDPLLPGTISNIFDKPTPLFVPLPSALGPDLEMDLRLSALLCSDTSCRPVELTRQVREAYPKAAGLTPIRETPYAGFLEQAEVGTAASPETSPPAEEAVASGELPELTPRYLRPGLQVGGLLKAVGLALVAGFILNLMPCVLPVVGLKLKGLLSGCHEQENEEPKSCFRRYNLFFALGILSYFLLLSVILASLDLAWGQIFQEPRTVLALTVLVFALGLSLFDVFHLPVIDLKTPGGKPSSPMQAFFTGALATLLATPCSGPFLGGVLAWALLQPAMVVAAVFAALGFGMASPYLFMAAKPGLLGIFNISGTWTMWVERLAGFFLLATCLYLLSILPQTLLLPALVALLVTAFAAWMWGSWAGPQSGRKKRLAVRGAALALVLGAFFWAVQPQAKITGWEEFDKEELAAEMGSTPLLVEFTADWCPTCKFIELTVLTPDNLAEWREEFGLRTIKVDLTRDNAPGWDLLDRLGAKSIPVTAVFPVGEGADSPLVLRDLFTAGDLEAALRRELGN